MSKPLFHIGSKEDLKHILEEHKKEEAKKIPIHILDFKLYANTGNITIKLDSYDLRIIDKLRLIPIGHRGYDGVTKNNSINILSWPSFLVSISELLKNEYYLSYKDKNLENKINNYINSPDIIIKINKYKSLIELDLIKITNIYLPSLSTLTRVSDRSYTLALAELYKFPEALSKNYSNLKVEYSKDALDILTSQLGHRKSLASIINANDNKGNTCRLKLPFKENSKGESLQRVADKFLELTNDKAIVAYDMGLGKSYIALNRAEKEEYKKVLIICPAQLKTNWANEIRKLTGKDCNFLSGVSPTDLDVKSLLQQRFKYNIINYDVIGRTIKDKDGSNSTMLWVEIINMWEPDLVIIDEVHYIKNMDSQRSIGVRAIEYKKVIPLSGTPLVNRVKELFPTLNVVAPEEFKNSVAFYAQFLSHDGKSAKNLPQLQEVLTTYMIRRKQSELEPPNRIDFHAEQSKEGKVRYVEILNGLYTSLKNPNFSRQVDGILAEITRLKQNTAADKVKFTVELAYTIQEEREEKEAKTLIFSQFIDTCNEIAFTLGKDCALITGEVKDNERYKIIEDFQNDKYKYLVLSTKIGAEGLTLTKAYNVIFNDLMWTPKDHMQAEARAYGRVNDMHNINSYYVIIPNTIDMWIYDMIKEKMKLIETVIDGSGEAARATESVLSNLIHKLRMGY